MLIFGHRGAAAVAPENTLASFSAALDARADGVEIDVRLTRDGSLVLMHEDDVARTTGAAGLLSAMTLEEVRALDAAATFAGWGRREPVPTLEEALDLLGGRVAVCAELKPVPTGDGWFSAVAVADLAAPMLAAVPRITVSSFDHAAMVRVRALLPDVRTAVTTPRLVTADVCLEAAMAGDHDECHVPVEAVDDSFVGRAVTAGKAVCVWTVNDAALARDLDAMGVSAIFSDDPGRIRA